MRLTKTCVTLLILSASDAFAPARFRQKTNLFQLNSLQENGTKSQEPCFWKSPDGMCRTSDGSYKPVRGQWEQRIQLKDLEVGQQLIGAKISNADLLQAKTGPKIFYECGVGRIDAKGNWQMVSGMLKVAKSYAKPSVVRKKVSRLSGKPVELYVHKISLDNGRLEVKLSLDDSNDELEKEIPKIPASGLKQGDELVGKIVQLKPYGCFIDVGANRNGLLHIQRVADLFEKYIDKEQGLEEAGLERGASIKVAVKSNEKKRLFLDFTQETKDLSKEAQKKEAEDQEAAKIEAEESAAAAFGLSTVEEEEDKADDISEDEASAWDLYAGDYGDDAYDDEDADIEDSLGLGSY